MTTLIKNNLSGNKLNEYMKKKQEECKEIINKIVDEEIKNRKEENLNKLIYTLKKLIIANIGDSRKILGKLLKNNIWESEILSRDHKLNIPEEYKE